MTRHMEGPRWKRETRFPFLRLRPLIAVLTAAVILAAACGGDDESGTGAPDQPATTTQASEPDTAQDSDGSAAAEDSDEPAVQDSDGSAAAEDSDEPAMAELSGTIGFIKGPHSAMEAEFEQQIIDDFNADVAPNVEVEFSTYDWPVHVAELTTLFASGSPPDAQYLVDLIYPSFAEQGQLHDMTELVNDPSWADERAAISPFAWDLAEQQGGTWGVPVLGAVYNIFINKDLLEEAGVADSWDDSYESMLAAARALTTDDVFGFAARTSAADFAWWDWYPYIHNAGGDVLSDDWSSCGLVGQDVVDAMQFLIDIHTAGVAPEPGSLTNQGLFDAFKAGKIAILHHETPNITDLNANPPDFEWDVAFAPPGPQGQTVMGNFGILSIAEASDNKDAAWAFIKHWASAPQVGRFAEQVSLQVVREDIIDDLFAENAAMAKVQSDLVPRVQGLQPHPQILEALQSAWPVAEDAFRGNLTGAEAIAGMCDAIDGVLAG